MKRCDKRDKIFQTMEEDCASDEEMEKMLRHNLYMYYADNIADYTEYSNFKYPYFKKNKALFYEHMDIKTAMDQYTSYQFNMQMNDLEFENSLFSYNAKKYNFLSYHTINKFTYTPKVVD